MIILAVVGDQHTNSTVGLCPPYVELDDGGSYHHSPLQSFLWEKWLEYIERVKAHKSLRKAKVCTVLNGDIFDGDHHNTFQIITRNDATMQKIAYSALAPLLEVSDRVYVVRGTGAHSGGSGRREEEFAEDVEAYRSGDSGPYSRNKLLLNLEGVVVDIAHHTSMGRLPWTAPNAANKLASKVLFKCANEGMTIPDLIFRSHNHRFSESGRHFRCEAICLPGWQGVTEYVNRFDDTAIADIGGAIVLCDRGDYDLEIFRTQPAPSLPEEVIL